MKIQNFTFFFKSKNVPLDMLPGFFLLYYNHVFSISLTSRKDQKLSKYMAQFEILPTQKEVQYTIKAELYSE